MRTFLGTAFLLCLSLWNAPMLAQDSGRPSFLPAPGRYAVGVSTRELEDASRPPMLGIKAPVRSVGRRLQVFEWYPAQPNGTKLAVLDYFRLADNPDDDKWKTRPVAAYLQKGFSSTEIPMLASFDAPSGHGRFSLII